MSEPSAPWEDREESPSATLERHLARIGATHHLTDAQSAMQIHMLAMMLDILKAALVEAGIHPWTQRRVIQSVIFGCTPQSHEAAERARIMTESVHAVAEDVRVEQIVQAWDRRRGAVG